MNKRHTQFPLLKQLVRWILLVSPVAIAIGSTVALFLWLLHEAIYLRFRFPYLLYFLPLAGLLIYFIYKKLGKSSEKGNNLVIEEIHKPGGGIPKRMAPIVLLCTVITHLFGGSAGREGTAVQIGGSIAQMFGNWFRLDEKDMKVLLTAGVAAGFGAVFGTPLAGAIFAMEVLTIGKVRYDSLLPCLFAGIIGDLTVSAWGLHHTAYHIGVVSLSAGYFSEYVSPNLVLLLKVVVSSIAFGLAAFFFSVLVVALKTAFHAVFNRGWLVPLAGGLIIILMTFILGKTDYLSLGVDAEYPGAITIPSAFQTGGADAWSWFWKTLYTAITLSSGFKGGEVTPLFYIGATLGNTLSVLLDAPVGLFAALGFIAVFAGATNTPLACTIMGVELFGAEYIHFFAVACFVAYFFSGHSGIYSSQRIAVPKIFSRQRKDDLILSDVNARRTRLMTRRIAHLRHVLSKRNREN